MLGGGGVDGGRRKEREGREGVLVGILATCDEDAMEERVAGHVWEEMRRMFNVMRRTSRHT